MKGTRLCVVVDNNIRSLVLHEQPSESHYNCLRRGILDRRYLVVYGGRLWTKEYQGSPETIRFVSYLDRNGLTRKVSDAEVNAEESRLGSGGLVRSDDPHIIALCRVSGARVVATT